MNKNYFGSLDTKDEKEIRDDSNKKTPETVIKIANSVSA